MLKGLKWFFMLNKRLYKKPSFIFLMILIPACVFAFSFIAKQNSGFITITLATEGHNDEISTSIIDELLNENSLINFTASPSSEDAILKVENGVADEAWIFPDNTDEKFKDYVKNENNYLVSVYTKEQNVSMRLAREKLSGVLYKYCAKAYYIDYIRAKFDKLDDLSDSELGLYFQNSVVDEDLFVFDDPYKNSDSENNSNYLLSPIRGLLAIFAILCALFATMYYKQDEISGTFSYVKNSRKGLVAFGCILTAVLNISVILMLSLYLSSLSMGFFKEILVLLLYAVCCSSFALLLGRIFTRLSLLSSIIPLLTVVFIGICPVFFDFRILYSIQLLLPPTYYVNSFYDNKHLIYMVIYTIICLSLSYLLSLVKKQRRF